MVSIYIFLLRDSENDLLPSLNRHVIDSQSQQSFQATSDLKENWKRAKKGAVFVTPAC